MNQKQIENDSRRLTDIYLSLCKHEVLTEEDRAFLFRLMEQSLPDEIVMKLLRAFSLLCDPASASWAKQCLGRTDNARVAAEGLRTLCHLGLTIEHKDYIMRAISPGYIWDKRQNVLGTAMYCIANYLRDNRDADLVKLIRSLVERVGDPLLLSNAEQRTTTAARMAAGVAMGADSAVLADDEEVGQAYVARFLAERRDG